MSYDDIIYLSLLFFSIGVGYFYRTIQGTTAKKIVGTSLGLFIILVVSGFHIIHNLIFILINSVIILETNKRYPYNVNV